MTRAKRILLSIVFLASTTTSFGARAYTVWDPSNFIQNLVTAISSVQTEATAAAQYAQQVHQTYEMIKATAHLAGGVSNLAEMAKNINSFHQLIAVNSQLRSSMEAALTLTRNMQAGFGASNYSWDTYMQQKVDNNTTRAEAYRGQYEQINADMQTNANRRQAILEKLDSAQGQTAATQAVGAQLDLLIGQQQQMLNDLKTTKQAEDYKLRQDQANKDAYNAYNRKVQDELRQSSGRFVRPYAQ